MTRHENAAWNQGNIEPKKLNMQINYAYAFVSVGLLNVLKIYTKITLS